MSKKDPLILLTMSSILETERTEEDRMKAWPYAVSTYHVYRKCFPEYPKMFKCRICGQLFEGKGRTKNWFCYSSECRKELIHRSNEKYKNKDIEKYRDKRKKYNREAITMINGTIYNINTITDPSLQKIAMIKLKRNEYFREMRSVENEFTETMRKKRRNEIEMEKRKKKKNEGKICQLCGNKFIPNHISQIFCHTAECDKHLYRVRQDRANMLRKERKVKSKT